MTIAVKTPTANAQTMAPLFQRALPNLEGKTFTSVIVEFPPGPSAAPHRHGEAFVWAYVLAGTMRIKFNDEPNRTYREGESWFEEPSTHHVIAQNASTTEPAKVLTVFISNTGDELKVDDDGEPASLGPGRGRDE
jgi:quercetin dioxygenase-like cupin family protein